MPAFQQWNASLAQEAQENAEECDPQVEQGKNHYYNVSDTDGHFLERLLLDRMMDNIESSVLQVSRDEHTYFRLKASSYSSMPQENVHKKLQQPCILLYIILATIFNMPQSII